MKPRRRTHASARGNPACRDQYTHLNGPFPSSPLAAGDHRRKDWVLRRSYVSPDTSVRRSPAPCDVLGVNQIVGLLGKEWPMGSLLASNIERSRKFSSSEHKSPACLGAGAGPGLRTYMLGEARSHSVSAKRCNEWTGGTREEWTGGTRESSDCFSNCLTNGSYSQIVTDDYRDSRQHLHAWLERLAHCAL